MNDRIIIGCWQLSKGHSVLKMDDVHERLLKYYDLGYTQFDFGDIYTGVEELFGDFKIYLAKNRGVDAVKKLRLYTKYVPDRNDLHDLTFKDAERIIDRSLKRLKSDCLDLVQFHCWDYDSNQSPQMAIYLDRLRKKGKIAKIGVTNFSATRLLDILDTGVEIYSTQNQYSLFDNRIEKNLIPLCKKYNLKMFSYGVLAGGILSNKYLGVNPEEINEINRSITKYKLIISDVNTNGYFVKLMERLHIISKKYQTDIASIVTSYILKKSIDKIILGFSYKNDVPKIVNLSLADIAAIENIFKYRVDLLGDTYSLERNESKHSSIMKYNLNSE